MASLGLIPNLRSMILGTSALAVAAVVACLLTLMRRAPKPDPPRRDRVINLLLIGISLQCLHFFEEFVTRFNERFPQQLGLSAWSNEFFVAFNMFCIAVWVLSAVGLQYNLRLAYFPVWFFIAAMLLNGLGHPLLAIAAGGYFPGLWTSWLVGIIGVILGVNFWKFTSASTISP
jgi:Protein of unknown function with HXXEE motif